MKQTQEKEQEILGRTNRQLPSDTTWTTEKMKKLGGETHARTHARTRARAHTHTAG
jgi:hypothetical protein